MISIISWLLIGDRFHAMSGKAVPRIALQSAGARLPISWQLGAWMARMAALDVVQKTRPPHWK